MIHLRYFAFYEAKKTTVIVIGDFLIITNVSNVKKQVLITHGKYGNAQINSLIFYIFATQFREMPIPKESRRHPEGIPKEQH